MQIINNISTTKVTPMMMPVMAPESESSLAEVEDRLFPPLLFPDNVYPLLVLAEVLIVAPPLAPPLLLPELEPPLLPLPDLDLELSI